MKANFWALATNILAMHPIAINKNFFIMTSYTSLEFLT